MKGWKNGRPDGWKNPFDIGVLGEEYSKKDAAATKPAGYKVSYIPDVVFEAGADALLKEVAKWGYEHCEHDKGNLQAVRAFCPICWQGLLKEIG